MKCIFCARTKYNRENEIKIYPVFLVNANVEIFRLKIQSHAFDENMSLVCAQEDELMYVFLSGLMEA